jgi:hypothetical protein
VAKGWTVVSMNGDWKTIFQRPETERQPRDDGV